MEPVLVLLPAACAPGLTWPGADVHRYSSPLDVPGILASCPLPAILVRDGIPASHAERIADVIRAHPRPVIAVATTPWDGETPDPIAAACRGIVAGFGLRAIDRLLELLRAEP